MERRRDDAARDMARGGGLRRAALRLAHQHGRRRGRKVCVHGAAWDPPPADDFGRRDRGDAQRRTHACDEAACRRRRIRGRLGDGLSRTLRGLQPDDRRRLPRRNVGLRGGWRVRRDCAGGRVGILARDLFADRRPHG